MYQLNIHLLDIGNTLNIDNNSMWSITAKRALWMRKPMSDLPMLEMPEVGNEYLIKFDGRDIKIGDTLNVSYLPAFAYYNGVETVRDLASIRIFSGIVKSAVPSRRIDGQPLEFDTEVSFEVQNASCLNDFGKQTAKSAANLNYWSYFHDGFFYNLVSLEEYVLLSWASDSYAGAKCIMQRTNGEFYALYCHEWFDGSFDRVHCGSVIVPSTLTEKLNRRLVTLGDGDHWSGQSI